jgi:2-oxoglutarate dehydrogenase complex dehydrogenase (E1) component-like enzyme
MFRYVRNFAFSKFYHPCEFKLTPEHAEATICSLGNYVKLYRKYGHHYAKLDPLGLYNKYFSYNEDPMRNSSGPQISNSSTKTPSTRSSSIVPSPNYPKV